MRNRVLRPMPYPLLPSRRFLLRRSACGFGMLGLSSLLNAAEAANSAGSEEAALSGESKASHFPVHARWTFASGHLRSEAAADQGSWKAAALQASADVCRRQYGEPAEVAVGVPKVRPERPRNQRAVSQRGKARGRFVHHPFHGGRQRGPRRGYAAIAYRIEHVHPAEHGIVGDLRAGHGESESTRVHHVEAGPLSRRREEMEFRFSSRGVSGNGGGAGRHAI